MREPGVEDETRATASGNPRSLPACLRQRNNEITPLMEPKIDFIGITTGISFVLSLGAQNKNKQKTESSKDSNQFPLGPPLPQAPRFG